VGEIKLIRELLEKDIEYLKESMEGLHDKVDDINGHVTKNTIFRQKAKTVIGFFGAIATVVGGVITIIINKIWN
jgi:hypothetical protein|tara:strand:+ start:292 stop:513 length:222 start_codon:yes stop_codon:yes gene_type:complete